MRSLTELMNLKGRKALVTGGAGHIGRAACETLKELGAQVAILDLPECDLKDEEATRGFIRGTISKMKGLDILVHCAAYVGTTKRPGWAVPFEDQTVEAWEEALRVNLTSAFVIAQETKKSLENSGKGSIIFFNSIYGIIAHDSRLYEGTDMRFPIGYSAAKGALLQLTRQLSVSFAPKVRVNSISPGGVWRNQAKVFHERYVEKTPLKRMATEEDLKGAIAYLASDLSQYVTGHNLVVDGGWTAW